MLSFTSKPCALYQLGLGPISLSLSGYEMTVVIALDAGKCNKDSRIVKKVSCMQTLGCFLQAKQKEDAFWRPNVGNWFQCQGGRSFFFGDNAPAVFCLLLAFFKK